MVALRCGCPDALALPSARLTHNAATLLQEKANNMERYRNMVQRVQREKTKSTSVYERFMARLQTASEANRRREEEASRNNPGPKNANDAVAALPNRESPKASQPHPTKKCFRLLPCIVTKV